MNTTDEKVNDVVKQYTLNNGKFPFVSFYFVAPFVLCCMFMYCYTPFFYLIHQPIKITESSIHASSLIYFLVFGKKGVVTDDLTTTGINIQVIKNCSIERSKLFEKVLQ